jgi:hypothetical protein
VVGDGHNVVGFVETGTIELLRVVIVRMVAIAPRCRGSVYLAFMYIT